MFSLLSFSLSNKRAIFGLRGFKNRSLRFDNNIGGVEGGGGGGGYHQSVSQGFSCHLVN